MAAVVGGGRSASHGSRVRASRQVRLPIRSTIMRATTKLVLSVSVLASSAATPPLLAQGSFVNFETPHVHPIDIVPGGSLVVAVNTADNRLEVFGADTLGLVHLA